MTPDELDRAIQFLLEHQAKFDARMEQLTGRMEQLVDRQDAFQTALEVGRKDAAEDRRAAREMFEHLVGVQNQLTADVGKVAGAVDTLAGSVAVSVTALSAAQATTDKRLNALIGLVDKLARRGNGSGHSGEVEDGMSVVIAVANQKGGVGKTTIARELSACCALRGYQVLAVDCDPQGNLTASWVDPDIYEGTLAHVLIEPEGTAGKKKEPLSLDETFLESPVERLDLVPADIRLARFEQQPEYLMHRLRKQLSAHASSYDLVFIDCPPQLGKLLTAAMYASDYVIVPCAADAMGLQGLADLAYTVEQIRTNVNSSLRMLGAVINLYKPQRNLSAESRTAVEAAVGLVGYVFDTNIHDYSKIAEAPSQKLPAVLYAPNHRAADQLSSLTDEVLDRLEMSRQKLAAVK